MCSVFQSQKRQPWLSFFTVGKGSVEDPLTPFAHLEPHRLGAGLAPDPVQVAVEAGAIAAKQHHWEGEQTHHQYEDAAKDYLSQGEGMKHDVTPHW